MKFLRHIALLALSLAPLGQPFLRAQAAPPTEHPGPTAQVKTFYLTNTFQSQEATELVTALRNILAPENKIYLVGSQNAIVVSGSPEQLEATKKLIGELDRPKKLYRLTYTVTEMDGGNRVGTQHFAVVVAGGQRTTLKQGSKVPVVTGNFTVASNSSESQFTYLDVGLNFDATLEEFVNGVRLRSKVERSSVAQSEFGPKDPMIRQTVLEGTSLLSVGKPLILGSLDIPETTRHLDVEVVMDIVH